MRPGAYRRWPILFACAALALASCGGGDGEASTPTTSSTTATTAAPTSTTTADEKAVLDAYQAYWTAWLSANDPPDQFNAELKTFSTGEAYQNAFDSIQSNRVQGRSLRLPENARYSHRATVTEITHETARVRDCNVDDAETVKTDSGELINGTVATKLIEATVSRVDGRWRVATLTVKQRWEGVADCVGA